MYSHYQNVFKVGAPSAFGGSPLAGGVQSGQAVGRLSQTEGANGGAFKNMLADMAQNVNQTMQAPTTMMEEHVMHGTHDIHDVMMANSKAELTVNIAAQFTTKIVQAYDRITQIQV